MSGYHLLLTNDPPIQPPALNNSSGQDGVIVHGQHDNDPRIALLKEVDLPFVMHSRAGSGDAPYEWVGVNNRPLAAGSSVRQIGQICAEMLPNIIQSPSKPAQRILLKVVVAMGKSTGPAPI
jgi:DNA-binding LacI/PurR family transcriptional regulator